MINKEMIKQGIDQGVIKFIIDPNMDEGTVCRIGEDWFYFGGVTAEAMSPEEYLKEVPINDIVKEIYDTLKDNSGGIFEDERKYYEAYLIKALNLDRTVYVVVEHYEDSCIEMLFKSRSEDEAKSFMKKRWIEVCNDAGIQLYEDCWEDSMTYSDSGDETYLLENYGCYYGDCNYHIQVLEIEL